MKLVFFCFFLFFLFIYFFVRFLWREFLSSFSPRHFFTYTYETGPSSFKKKERDF